MLDVDVKASRQAALIARSEQLRKKAAMAGKTADDLDWLSLMCGAWAIALNPAADQTYIAARMLLHAFCMRARELEFFARVLEPILAHTADGANAPDLLISDLIPR